MNLYVHDPRQKWITPFLQAAKSRGWNAKVWEQEPDGYLLFLPHANPKVLAVEKATHFPASLRLIADRQQIQCYEAKRLQTALWHSWMPLTVICDGLDVAMLHLEQCAYPIVSKADVGASSMNVRILPDRRAAEKHVRQLFTTGLTVEHCDSMGTRSVQKGYAILQEFIPHEITWRVNAIGNQRAIFRRYCYPDRPVAQTGNVRPIYRWDELPDGLMDFADEWFAAAGTRWCAGDFLFDAERNEWRFIESSPRWPWPSPGDCMNAAFFREGEPSRRKWSQMWEVLMDELEASAFGMVGSQAAA